MQENKQPIRHRNLTSTVEVKPRGRLESADIGITARSPEQPMFGKQLMEVICERDNLRAALKRVKQNQGAAGIDGMSVDDLGAYLKENWLTIKAQLQNGGYQPKPIRRVTIPKSNGKGKRKLGIACVVDRFIQQAILQVLQPSWDKRFSENSFGFRPGCSAHQAVAKAQNYVLKGYSYVVDIDLDSFFDRVQHDRLVSKLAQEIADRRVIKLIRAYLNVGVLEKGLVKSLGEGVSQGSPLSPLLSNIVLDELDKELEKRGHCHVRFADDCNIYVKSQRAGERVMKSISEFITQRLKLKVNEGKSAVDIPQNRKFLGFSFTGGKQPNRRKIAPDSVKRFKARLRQLTRRNRSQSIKVTVKGLSVFLRGWRGYYGYCETPTVLKDLDCWIRRRLRCIHWKQWKTYRKRKQELMARGIKENAAQTASWSPLGPWKMSHIPPVRMALNNSYFEGLGLCSLHTCN